jgi:ActR/RegA family two-component response regulator
MSQPSSLLVVDADARSLETLTFGFEREGCKVTGTTDLKRAPLLVRSEPHDVAVVALREPEQSALETVAAVRQAAGDLPIVVLGPQGMKPEALRAGAAEFLALPTFLRDVIGVGRLTALGTKRGKTAGAQTGAAENDIQTRLSEHYGLFYLLRAMAASERSGILTLTRGNRRAELRIHEGAVVSAAVGAMQGLPALHHLLLWEEAALALANRAIPKRSQLHLSAQEILDECERFLRDFAHAAKDLGSPRTLYVAVGEGTPAMRGLQPSQVTPLLRLFDGRRVLADVIEESPFRIFDTVRMIRRMRESGALTIKSEEAHERPAPRDTRTGGQLGGDAKNGAAKSMLAEWAMVPDQRGVVGDRRTTSRRLRPIQQPVPATAPVPAPAPAPIQLTAKKATGATASGELSAAQANPTPPAASASLLAVAPTVQVQLDATGMPLGEPVAPSDPNAFPTQTTPPPVRARGVSGSHAAIESTPPPARSERTPAPIRGRGGSGRHAPLEDAPAPIRGRGGSGRHAPLEDAPAPIRGRGGSGRHAPLEDAPAPKAERSEKTPRPRRVSGDNSPTVGSEEFDALEADFFAREADLYKREAIETFDDLEPVAGIPGHRPKK